MTDQKTATGGASAYLSLAAVCLFWGTTYLGIRIALEGLPPLYLIAIRYLISGALMCAGVLASRVRLPTRRELRQTAICGIISIGIGNGCLAIAEQWVPSGTAALYVTTLPFWMVGIDGMLPGGRKPRATTIAALLVGLTGVAFLLLPDVMKEGLGGSSLAGFLVLQIGSAGWVLGATLQKRVPSRAHPLVSGAVQQLATGIAMFVPAMLFERLPASVGPRPALAVAYLVVFGSIVGYSAFVYAMARLPIAIVSIYTFVNPVVAILLGWAFYRERFGWRELLAMLIIFAGIALVKLSEARPRVPLLEQPASVVKDALEAGRIGE